MPGVKPAACQPADVGDSAIDGAGPSVDDDTEAEAHFTSLGHAELDEELRSFRIKILSLLDDLQEFSDQVVDLQLSTDVKVKKGEFEDLGEEGVDYHLGCIDDVDPSEWLLVLLGLTGPVGTAQVPQFSIPVHANVTTYDWSSLIAHTQFDVIMMDPPWQLATANPTRGVALGYSQLTDDDIINLPVPKLQSNGFLFVWVINAKIKFTLDLFEKWGYKLVDEIVWVKMTVNRRMAKSHGYYLQHAKEVCLVGKKGADPPGMQHGVGSDIIYSERRGQSQKPEEIYQLVEELIPGGRYLEIFGRKNNLRDWWVTVGNEVTGTGLPPEDLEALKVAKAIPGAVYGAAATRD